MTVFDNVFTETAAVLAVAAVISTVAAWLRQPLIAAYIASGLLVGPACFGWVTRGDPLELLAHMGIALLLFVVGLKLAPQLVRTLGWIVLKISLAQVAITVLLGCALALLLGFSPAAAGYLAVGLAFSSTVVIVKMLSDKGESDSLHGRLALGAVIVQDVLVVVAMALLTAVAGAAGDVPARDVFLRLIEGILLLLAIAVFARYGLARLLGFLARSPELLTLAAIAWAVALAATGHAVGLSKEVGALVAGVALAATPYRELIAMRLATLRDFLLLFFFVELGTQVSFDLLGRQLVPILALSAFVLVGKPLVVMALVGRAGFHRRTLGLTGLYMGQVSVFSLILVGMGLELGHLDAPTVGVMTLVALITITCSGYVIDSAHPVVTWLAPWLERLEHRERRRGREAPIPEKSVEGEVILVGLGRFGERMALNLAAHGLAVVGIDFDPEVVRGGAALGIASRYGDATDPELVGSLPLGRAEWVVSTIPAREVNLTLLQALRRHGYEGGIAVAAYSDADSMALKAAGAELVLLPFQDAADQAVDLVTGHDRRVLPVDVPPPAAI
jgi:Kef-type K+ transport system membrane component KefB